MAFGRLKSHRNKLQVKDTILKLWNGYTIEILQTQFLHYGYFGF